MDSCEKRLPAEFNIADKEKIEPKNRSSLWPKQIKLKKPDSSSEKSKVQVTAYSHMKIPII